VAAPLFIRQAELGDDLEAIAVELTAAFEAIRAALAEERPVVVLVDDADLLGQGEVADAALATGLLGLARSFALEGARRGWKVNTVSRRSAEQEQAAADAAAWLAASGLSGQLVRAGTDHLGRVWP
jgi:NAD(P)-dependent dehydrogenase (short-subunit alcohol dehydrogenase family)